MPTRLAKRGANAGLRAAPPGCRRLGLRVEDSAAGVQADVHGAHRSMTGSPLPPEPTKMEDMLQRYEKLHQAELRRMKKHFSKVVSANPAAQATSPILKAPCRGREMPCHRWIRAAMAGLTSEVWCWDGVYARGSGVGHPGEALGLRAGFARQGAAAAGAPRGAHILHGRAARRPADQARREVCAPSLLRARHTAPHGLASAGCVTSASRTAESRVLMDHEERLEKRQEEEKARIAKKEAEAKQLIEERGECLRSGT
eukprot:1344388-Rhodomonas_salina.4